MKELLRLNLQEFAEEVGDQPTPEEAENKPEQIEEPTEKTFTQAEMNDILAKRLKREKEKQAELDEKLKKLEAYEKAEEERKKAEMSELERLAAEKEEAAKKAEEATEQAKKAQEAANQRIINTEIRSIARALNANDPNQVLALLDKAGVELGEDGSVVGAEEAVKAFKEASPWMFKQSFGADASGGSNPAKNPSLNELSQLEKDLEDAKKQALTNSRFAGKVTEIYNKIVELKRK